MPGEPEPASPQALEGIVRTIFLQAAANTLPQRIARANQPWISDATLALVDERDAARRQGHIERELELNKEVKQAARADKGRWLDDLDDLESTGSWGSVKGIRKGFKPQQGRLKNLDGHLVASEERLETLAE